jgi:hypothetical protein
MPLDNIAKQVNDLIVGQPENKKKFCKHIEKVIREAERYRQYLLKQQRKAKKAGWLFYDESKAEQYRIYQLEQMAVGKPEKYKEELWEQWRNEKAARKSKPVPKPFPWTWILNAYSDICKQTYFTEDEWSGKKGIPPVIQFYIAGKPAPNPLGYLESMIWGCIGAQVYRGLELLDYQFVLLAIIHDAQYSADGQERIYFNKQGKEILSDRLCGAVWERLVKSSQSQYGFPKDVQRTIETALLAVEAKPQPAKGTKIKKRRSKWLILVVVAIIGSPALVPVISWLRDSHSKEQGVPIQKNVSTSPDVETKGNLSPAIVTSGPNSPVNIFISHSQPDSNVITQPLTPTQDTSQTLPDSNLSPPESPNQ